MDYIKLILKKIKWPTQHWWLAILATAIIVTAGITSAVVRSETNQTIKQLELKNSELATQHETDADTVWRQARIIEASEKLNTAVIDYFKLYGETFTNGKSDKEIEANVKRLIEMRFTIQEAIKAYEQAKQ